MGANKITVAIVVLVAICVASLVAVRQLTKSQQINNPVINVATQDAAATTTQPTTQPTTAPTTASTVPTSESQQDQSTTLADSDTLFTTFNTSGDNSTLSDPSTTLPTTTLPTTTMPVTTLPTTTLPTTAPTTSSTAAVTSSDININQAAQTSQGFMSYLFNDEGNFYYTEDDPWQRHFGFNKVYDFGAQFVFMYYDTARIYFDYGEKNWMVQMWKGQYGGVFIGAEIGVYTKPKDREVEHYDCANDDEALKMDMSFYRNGEELLSRDYGRYWWCTGFVPGKLKKYSDRSELSIKTRITMKDKTMRKAFVEGLKNCEEFNFVEGENFTVDGLDVFINW